MLQIDKTLTRRLTPAHTKIPFLPPITNPAHIEMVGLPSKGKRLDSWQLRGRERVLGEVVVEGYYVPVEVDEACVALEVEAHQGAVV
jgi:hypothetical protein